jgi:opacity protein-like surface antigen
MKAVVLAALAALLGAAALFAPAPARAEPKFEITPFVGGRVGGNFDVTETASATERSVDLDDGASFGVDLGLYAHNLGFYELLYASQRTSFDSGEPALAGADVRIDYLHVGGTALFPDDRFYVPYVSFTLGATLLEPEGPYDSETKFSMSLGGGFRFPLSEHMTIVLGLRGYLTLIDSDTDLFCASGPEGGACLVKSSGSTFFQAEGQLGFSFVF